jgi:hypothetical protein
MKRTPVRALVAALAASALLASAALAHTIVIAPTELLAVSATAADGVLSASGEAIFGGQHPVDLGSDPAGDNTGGAATAPFGADLRGAQIYQPDPDKPELLFEIRVEQLLPLVGSAPESTQHIWDFTVDGKTSWSLVIARSRLADYQGIGGYGVLQQCVPNGTGVTCTTKARLSEVEFRDAERVVRAGVPLALIGAGPGSTIAPWSRTASGPIWAHLSVAGRLNVTGPMLDAIADHARYTVPAGKRVDLEVLRADGATEAASAAVAADDTFSGSIATGDGPATAVVRACFAANCDEAVFDVDGGSVRRR